jgi:hypothetical protein
MLTYNRFSDWRAGVYGGNRSRNLERCK